MTAKRLGIILNRVPGYSETFFRSKIAGLNRKGYEIYLFAHGTKNLKIDGAKIVFSPKVSKFVVLQAVIMMWTLVKMLLFIPGRVSKFINLEKKDGTSNFEILRRLYLNSHILSSNNDILYFGFLTVALERENVAKAIGAKMYVGVRGYDISIYPLKNPGCYSLLWDKTDKIHVISDALKRKVYNHGFPGSKDIIKITPAIDYKRFYKRREPDKKEVTNVSTVGRLTWKKGYEYSFAALKKLKEKGYKIKYNVIGEGDDYERLKFAAYQYGIVDMVEFHGALSHKRIVESLWDTDIYLQPSVQEGFCNAALEAQAAGCLSIVSDAEGLPENVLNEITGWVVPRRDVQELADRIESVINLKADKKLEVIENAQKRVKEEFNIDGQITKFIEFYEN